jgi:acyl dehydratase
MKNLINTIKLFYRVLRNIKSNKMNKNCVGQSITRDYGPLSNKDLQLYATATRDNPEKYDEPGCQIPPFYSSILMGNMFHKLLSHKDLKMNIIRMVHAKQEVVLHKTIHQGDTIKVKLFINEINNTEKGEECIITSHSTIGDELCQEGQSTFLVISPNRKSKQKKPEKELEETFRHPIETKEGQQLLYARVSKDTNFIHTSNFLAKLAGFPRTIMHGICIQAMACNTLLEKELNGNLSSLKSLTVSFSKPVFPGDTVYVTGSHNKKTKKINFVVKKKSGKAAIKNGLLTYK